MPATVNLCQRTGSPPGTVTQRCESIAWKAVDNATTPYTAHSAVLALGTNSYQVYNFIKFSGIFTTIANVKVSHTAGNLGQGIVLKSNNSIVDTTQRPQYAAPSRSSTAATPNNLSALGSECRLLVGSAPDNLDGASYDNKANSADNVYGTSVYSTYFITQLQVAANAQIGDLSGVTLTISYDEI